MILIVLLLAVFSVAVFLGCAAADSGCKKIGGYFDANTFAAIESDQDYYYITILNEKFTLRRF